MCSLITSKLLDLTACSLYQASTHGTVFGEGSLLSWHLPFDMELKFSETKQVKSPNPKWWLLLNSVLNTSSLVNVTGLGCAGPVWDDWVEPVWFLPPELCCLCRIFVPAWQAPTVINSLDHSACSLKQTKKWWGRVRVQGGKWGEREREREGDRQTHTVICWHRQTRGQQLPVMGFKQTHSPVWMAIYDWSNSKVDVQLCSVRCGIPWEREGKKRDSVHTVNFNYPLIQAAFGQLIPRLPFLYGHRRTGVWCSQAAVSQ